MIEKVLDLHIHSKYSRACSKNLELPQIAKMCERKGIDISVTGDFTHPGWFAHLKENLIEDTVGIYKLKDGSSKTKFIIGTEIASIKKHKDKTRRLHLLVFAPTLEVAEKFNNILTERGFNLKSDGRPILGMIAKDILALMLEIDPRMVMIPAHAWTPWFGVFGSNGGYDSLEECFEELTPNIFAIETGLSSNPPMNWRLSALDNISLVSNSDAHSLEKLGREANVLNFESEKNISYGEIMRIIKDRKKEEFLRTIEFYPEEGKYHVDGHRDCGFYCEPEETKRLKGLCPKCKKPLIIGVMNRVVELSDRSEEEVKAVENKIPFSSLVPLAEILADIFSVGVSTKRVKTEYEKMINFFGNEFFILLHVDLKDIEKEFGKQISLAIERVRSGNIFIRPGYDGEFGEVKVFKDNENKNSTKQVSLDLD